MAFALPRFSLRQLLTLITVVAIVLTLIPIVWSIITPYRPPAHIYNSVSYLTFSPDGKQLAVILYHAHDAQVPGKRYVADVTDAVAILDMATLSDCSVVAHQFREGNQGPDLSLGTPAVAFSPDGTRLHVHQRNERRFRTWDIASSGWSADHVTYEPNFSGLMRLPNAIYSAAITRRGVEVRDVHTGQLVRTVHQSDEVLDRVTCIALSPDGDTIAVRCSEGLRLYSIGTGTEQIVLPEFFHVRRSANGWGTTTKSGDTTYGIRFSSDGKIMVAWGEYGLKFFDMRRGCRLQRSVDDPTIHHFAFSPDGKTYATGGSNGKLTLRDVATSKELRSTVPFHSLGRQLAQ